VNSFAEAFAESRSAERIISNSGISDSLVYFHQVKKFPKPMLSFFRADRIIFACDIAPSGL